MASNPIDSWRADGLILYGRRLLEEHSTIEPKLMRELLKSTKSLPAVSLLEKGGAPLLWEA